MTGSHVQDDALLAMFDNTLDEFATNRWHWMQDILDSRRPEDWDENHAGEINHRRCLLQDYDASLSSLDVGD